MSHYSYKEKAFLKVGDKILPLAIVAESNVTSVRFDCKGRRREYNPTSWMICSIVPNTNGILYTKEEMENARKEMVAKELESLQRSYEKYSFGEEPPTMKSKNYYGNVYPTGSSVQAMKSFFGTRKLMSLEDFFLKYRSLTLKVKLYEDEVCINEASISVDEEDDILRFNDVFSRYKQRSKEDETKKRYLVYDVDTFWGTSY